jgi:hypothetical protein
VQVAWPAGVLSMGVSCLGVVIRISQCTELICKLAFNRLKGTLENAGTDRKAPSLPPSERLKNAMDVRAPAAAPITTISVSPLEVAKQNAERSHRQACSPCDTGSQVLAQAQISLPGSWDPTTFLCFPLGRGRYGRFLGAMIKDCQCNLCPDASPGRLIYAFRLKDISIVTTKENVLNTVTWRKVSARRWGGIENKSVKYEPDRHHELHDLKCGESAPGGSVTQSARYEIGHWRWE